MAKYKFASFLSDDNVLHEVTPNKIRQNLNHLNERDMMNLKAAMMDLQRDQDAGGYQVSDVLCVVLLQYWPLTVI